jgi:DNA-binding transcriptional regulator YiaG
VQKFRGAGHCERQRSNPAKTKPQIAAITMHSEKLDGPDHMPLGEALLEGLREAAEWKRGEIELPDRNVPSLTSKRMNAIRKRAAKTSREIARRFGIPVRTLEGWEQGRRQHPAASVLLRGIERNPKAVEDVVMGKVPLMSLPLHRNHALDPASRS